MGALDQVRGALGGHPFSTGAIGKGAIPRPGGVAFGFRMAAVAGNSLKLTYTKALDTMSVPAVGAFAVTFDGTANVVTAVAIAGREVTLTLTTAAISTTTNIEIDYTVPAMNPIQDLAGTDAEALTDQAVENDTDPPMLSTAAVNGSTLTLTFDETLDTGSVPAVGDFAVAFDGTANVVTAVAVAGMVVTLTLTTAAVNATSNITVGYTAGTNPIQNTFDDPAPDFTGQAVTNDTPKVPVSTTYALRTIANVRVLFDDADGRPNSPTSQGWWREDTGGSSASANTGPGTNNTEAFMHIEASSATAQQMLDRSRLVMKSSVDWLSQTDRKVTLRACAQSPAGDGFDGANRFFDLQGSTDGTTWASIGSIRGWPYSNNYDPGETATQFQSAGTVTFAATGGWVDFEFNFDDSYSHFRMHYNTDSTAFRQDFSMYQITLEGAA